MEAWLKNPASLFDVSGKVAIVTGASGAFGALAAQVLAGAGARLALAAGNKGELEKVAALCRELGAEVTTINRRPSTEADCEAITEDTVKAFGGIDILVVASGMNAPAPIVDMPLSQYESIMDANVTDSWMMSKSVGKRMIAAGNGGKVVLMSSARGKLGHPGGYSAYCASKSAIDGITKALGCEWGKYNITVNAIAPTVFRSALTAWMFEADEKATAVRNGFLARVPLGRLGEPEDLAGPLLFLCSPASSFYTGHILDADGGYSAG
jgi:NAD(P)-dependent dehydrogenase (short-subunit alcohol dehydrogenase family)